LPVILSRSEESLGPERFFAAAQNDRFWNWVLQKICSDKILPFGCLSGILGVDKCSSKSARRGIMKYLLTSSGISNDSIHKALVDLMGKPIAESSALVIPTLAGHPVLPAF
jgi:hypothetical protein